jgi:hypothetical protein
MDHISDNARFKEIERNIELVQADPITQHGFTQVPNFLFKKSGLSMGAIVVYSKFLSFAWHNDYWEPRTIPLLLNLGRQLSFRSS